MTIFIIMTEVSNLDHILDFMPIYVLSFRWTVGCFLRIYRVFRQLTLWPQRNLQLINIR